MKAAITLTLWTIAICALLLAVAALRVIFKPMPSECSVTLYDGAGNISHEIQGEIRL